MQGIPEESVVWISQAVCVWSILVLYSAPCQLLSAKQCPWNWFMAVMLQADSICTWVIKMQIKKNCSTNFSPKLRTLTVTHFLPLQVSPPKATFLLLFFPNPWVMFNKMLTSQLKTYSRQTIISGRHSCHEPAYYKMLPPGWILSCLGLWLWSPVHLEKQILKLQTSALWAKQSSLEVSGFQKQGGGFIRQRKEQFLGH